MPCSQALCLINTTGSIFFAYNPGMVQFKFYRRVQLLELEQKICKLIVMMSVPLDDLLLSPLGLDYPLQNNVDLKNIQELTTFVSFFSLLLLIF